MKKEWLGLIIFSLLIFIGVVFSVIQINYYKDTASHIDPILEQELKPDSSPLANKPNTSVKTKKNTKTSNKTVTLKKAATKTYTSKLPNKTKKTSKTQKKNDTTVVKTDTTVLTQVTEKYTKKSKKKRVTTKVTTTIKTTTTIVPKIVKETTYETTIEESAKKIDTKVKNAFTDLGFKIIVKSNVNYSGYFSAKDKSITLNEKNFGADPDVIYHELGHFVGFISGNYDTSTDFKNIYNAESKLYSGYNKAYVTQNEAEYFAESVKDYITSPNTLLDQRPQTYKAIQTAFDKITTSQITKIKMILKFI